MFVTTQAMRLEMASCLVPGVEVWDAVEVELAIPILLLTTTDGNGDTDAVISRTFFAKPHHIANLGAEADVCLSRVDLFSPAHLNGTGAWRLDALSEIWECREPDGALSWLFVLDDGQQLSDSLHRLPTADLVRLRCVYAGSDANSRRSTKRMISGRISKRAP